jgi:hypothetical protein
MYIIMKGILFWKEIPWFDCGGGFRFFTNRPVRHKMQKIENHCARLYTVDMLKLSTML